MATCASVTRIKRALHRLRLHILVGRGEAAAAADAYESWLATAEGISHIEISVGHAAVELAELLLRAPTLNLPASALTAVLPGSAPTCAGIQNLLYHARGSLRKAWRVCGAQPVTPWLLARAGVASLTLMLERGLILTPNTAGRVPHGVITR